MATLMSFKADILSISPSSEWGANTWNVSCKTLYGGHFKLSTQLKYQITLLYSPNNAAA